MSKNKFDDMRSVLICFADAMEQDLGVMGFATKVQVLMGMSDNRKIQALCYLFDNLLQTNASLTTILQQANGDEQFDFEGNVISVTKEDAFAALQMAITAMAHNYQNGTNE